MPGLSDSIPDVDVLFAMEPELLAGHMLRLMNSDGRMMTLNHWMNDVFSGSSPAYPGARRNHVFQALAEAWNWLEAQGLVVWPDESNGVNG